MPEVSAEVQPTDANISEPVTAKNVIHNCCKWKYLPYEIWMIILVDYGAKAEDLAALERCCKWFSLTWTSAGMWSSPRIFG